MFDVRYHIVSLVAVFLALAIGIMLGSSIENRGLLKKQQERLVKSIEEDIASIRKKNADLQKEIDSQKEYEKIILPALIKNKLKERKIALVYFNDAGSQTLKTAVVQTLQQAGAQVEEVALNRSSFVKMRLPGIISSSKNKNENIDRFAEELARAPGPVMAQLKKEEVWEPSTQFIPVNAVIMFAGGNRESLEEMALASALKKRKLKIVFIDKSDNQYSKISQFIKAGIDSVDNINMVYGRISLVYLLMGSGGGHFGVKQSAEALMPALN